MDWKPKVIKCHCKSEYQDKKYGPGLRLCTAQGGKHVGEYCCTVCGLKGKYPSSGGTIYA